MSVRMEVTVYGPSWVASCMRLQTPWQLNNCELEGMVEYGHRSDIYWYLCVQYRQSRSLITFLIQSRNSECTFCRIESQNDWIEQLIYCARNKSGFASRIAFFPLTLHSRVQIPITCCTSSKVKVVSKCVFLCFLAIGLAICICPLQHLGINAQLAIRDPRSWACSCTKEALSTPSPRHLRSTNLSVSVCGVRTVQL